MMARRWVGRPEKPRRKRSAGATLSVLVGERTTTEAPYGRVELGKKGSRPWALDLGMRKFEGANAGEFVRRAAAAGGLAAGRGAASTNTRAVQSSPMANKRDMLMAFSLT